MHRADTIVVGLGAMGACAVDALARRGVRVVGLDRFAPPHGRGSSHGGSRVIRLSYFEHPDYVPLLREAYDGFDRLSRDAGERLRHETGLVVGGPPGSSLTEGMRRSAALHDLAVDAMDGAALARRFPQFEVPADWEVVFEARGGFVRPEATIRAALASAVAHGAWLEPECAALAWRADRDGVVVESERGAFAGRALVLAGGAWMRGLAGGGAGALADTLEVTRQTIVWIDDGGARALSEAELPVWLFDRGDRPAVYGIPSFDGMAFDGMGEPRGMKVALHGGGPACVPEAIDEPVYPARVDETLAATLERIPALHGHAPVAARHCLYTMSRDEHFVLGLHPAHGNVAIACGFSGHGFKFAPVVGEILADLATEGRTSRPIGFLAPTRRLPPMIGTD